MSGLGSKGLKRMNKRSKTQTSLAAAFMYKITEDEQKSKQTSKQADQAWTSRESALGKPSTSMVIKKSANTHTHTQTHTGKKGLACLI